MRTNITFALPTPSFWDSRRTPFVAHMQHTTAAFAALRGAAPVVHCRPLRRSHASPYLPFCLGFCATNYQGGHEQTNTGASMPGRTTNYRLYCLCMPEREGGGRRWLSRTWNIPSGHPDLLLVRQPDTCSYSMPGTAGRHGSVVALSLMTSGRPLWTCS